MRLSILIPAQNEENNILGAVLGVMKVVEEEAINYEIIVINDHSTDRTELILNRLTQKYPHIKYVNNSKPNGFGLAIQKGLECFTGDAAIIFMADGSDNPEDIVKYYQMFQKGYACVFGSRFIKGSKVENCPIHKLILNRFANYFIKALFCIDHNDITNAFKGYRREVINNLKPFLSHDFNINVELPLKAVVRRYSYAIVPISWFGRKRGVTKFKIREMGIQYLFIIFYIFFERFFLKKVISGAGYR